MGACTHHIHASEYLTQALHNRDNLRVVSLAPTAAPASVKRHLLLPFLAYFLLLASTSFIAGGIVHVGLGENTAYYIALTIVGIVCFTIGNYLQEFVLRKNSRSTPLGTFLLVSFVLSIGMGMMTGGVQHFLDNPAYSAVLIPIGLMLAISAFTWREEISLGRKLPLLLGGTFAVAVLLFGGLKSLSGAVSEPTGHGHGAPSVTAPPAVNESVPAAVSSGTHETQAVMESEGQHTEVPAAGAHHDDGH